MCAAKKRWHSCIEKQKDVQTKGHVLDCVNAFFKVIPAIFICPQCDFELRKIFLECTVGMAKASSWKSSFIMTLLLYIVIFAFPINMNENVELWIEWIICWTGCMAIQLGLPSPQFLRSFKRMGNICRIGHLGVEHLWGRLDETDVFWLLTAVTAFS